MFQIVQHLRVASLMLLFMTVLTGGAYPALVTTIAQLIFTHQANGSLISKDGRSVGSELIGQSFSSDKYFWGRLSATTSVPYNAAASGGSNLGPRNPTLIENAKARITSLKSSTVTSENAEAIRVPVDLVTSSASGLDPDISPAAALYQVSRVAKARGIADTIIKELVLQTTQYRQFGVLGESRVNVLRLNLALDELAAKNK